MDKGKHQSESTKLKISLSLKALNKTKITQRKRRGICVSWNKQLNGLELNTEEQIHSLEFATSQEAWKS